MRISIITIVSLLLMAGCVPSVRYTRDQADKQPGMHSASQREIVGEDSVQSEWETDVGERHQSGWLNSALSEASGQSAGGSASRNLEQVVSSYIGVPYRYGGTTRAGFDCSGFVTTVYREVYGITLKRTSSAMWKEGVPVALSAARPGDLVFFKGGAFGTVDHVGVYMGRTRFAHASTSAGVRYSNLKETYHARRFIGVRRMF